MDSSVLKLVMGFLGDIEWLFVASLVSKEWNASAKQYQVRCKFFARSEKLKLHKLLVTPGLAKWCLVDLKIRCDDTLCMLLVRARSREWNDIEKMMRDRGWDEPHGCQVMCAAARVGDLEVLKWTKDQSWEPCQTATIQAVRHGEIDCLEWMLDNKFPQMELCYFAALYHQLGVLSWLRDRDLYWEERVYVGAVDGDHRDILQAALDDGKTMKEPIVARAAAIDKVELLRWFVDRGCPLSVYCFYQSSFRGHLECLKWLRRNGCPWNETACSMAAAGGKIHILRWLRKKGCPWDEKTMQEAAGCGHMDILQWARQQGCPWNEWTSHFAVIRGYLDVVRWLLTNGCPCNTICLEAAAGRTSISLMEILLEHGAPLSTTVCLTAISSEQTQEKRLEAIAWLLDRGCPMGVELCVEASHRGELEILKFLRERGCPWSVLVISSAQANGHFELAEWARNNGCPTQ